MDGELEQGLKKLTGEISVFLKFMSEIAENTDDRFAIDYFALSLTLNDFYKKNKNRYNENQLVYQFLTQKYKGNKEIIRMYNTFRKLKESGDITIPNY